MNSFVRMGKGYSQCVISYAKFCVGVNLNAFERICMIFATRVASFA